MLHLQNEVSADTLCAKRFLARELEAPSDTQRARAAAREFKSAPENWESRNKVNTRRRVVTGIRTPSLKFSEGATPFQHHQLTDGIQIGILATILQLGTRYKKLLLLLEGVLLVLSSLPQICRTLWRIRLVFS
jgi:hypothetical protein